MEAFKVSGGRILEGEVRVSGAKNAALPIFAATLLTEETCTITNVPDLSDMRFMLQILEHLGATVESAGEGTWKVTAKTVDSTAPYDLVRKMRASICLLGPMVARLKKANISLPGGCVIGQRPIDLHIKGLRKLGCDVEISAGYVKVDAENSRGANLFLGGRHGSTVTGTANLIMAAVMTPGETFIEGAACEPEVVDLCRMLVSMGAKMDGVGSHSIKIEGVDELHGCEHRVIDDRIEAGTYLIGGAITSGDVTVHGAQIRHLGAFVDKLEEMGCEIDVKSSDSIRIRKSSNTALKPVDIITLPYPGYPTDLQAQMTALMTVTPGISIVTERIYPNRFMHIPELQRMGADIAIEGSSAIVKGGGILSGAPVMASDLRASAALVLAAIAGRGETYIQRIYHLDRGYDNFEVKLRGLGGQIDRISDKDIPDELLNS